jgi:hypothetical protein
MDRPGKRRKEDDLTLKCIAPIRVRDFGRVESQLSFFLFLSTYFFSFLIFSSLFFLELLTLRPGKEKSCIKDQYRYWKYPRE